MTTPPETTAFERGVRPLLQLVLRDKAEVVLNFHPDPALQNRIKELATKSTEGELSEEEREALWNRASEEELNKLQLSEREILVVFLDEM